MATATAPEMDEPMAPPMFPPMPIFEADEPTPIPPALESLPPLDPPALPIPPAVEFPASATRVEVPEAPRRVETPVSPRFEVTVIVTPLADFPAATQSEAAVTSPVEAPLAPRVEVPSLPKAPPLLAVGPSLPPPPPVVEVNPLVLPVPQLPEPAAVGLHSSLPPVPPIAARPQTEVRPQASRPASED